MTSGGLGRLYGDGEIIARQGETGRCMYVVQEGSVEVVVERDGNELVLATRGEGDVLGEMAIFEQEVRMATLRARGSARILTVDRKTFLRRVHEDPSLAYRVVQTLSSRVRELSEEVARLKAGLPDRA